MNMSKISEAVKNSYFVLLFSVIGIIIGYLLRIFLSRSLSLENFGLFYAVSAFMGVFILIRYIGLNQAVAKYIPEFLIRDEKNKVKTLVILVIVVQTITIMIFTGLVFIFKDAITASLFKTDTAGTVLILMTLSFLPSMFFVLFQSAFQGYQKMKTYALIEPVRISLTFLLSIAFIGSGASGVAFAYLLAAVLTTCIFVYSFYKLGITRAKTEFSHKFTKFIFKFSTPVFVSSIAIVLINYTDTLVITFYKSLSDVALYQVALPTSQLLLVFSNAMIAVALPLISGLYAHNKTEEIGKSLKAMNFLLVLLMMPFVIILFSFPEAVIRILFGDSFLGATLALQILSIGMICYSMFAVFQTTLDGIGKPLLNTKIMFLMAGINLLLNIILVPIFGIIGSAIAFFVSFAVGALVGYMYVNRYIKSSVNMVKIIKVILSAVASMAIVTFLVKNIFTQMPFYENFVFSVLLGIFIYVAIIIVSKTITADDVLFIESKNIRIPRIAKTLLKLLRR